MKILFFLGHPAHFHLFKNTIKHLKNNNYEVDILVKSKDILEELLQISEMEYTNILPAGRSDGVIGIAGGLIKKDIGLYRFCKLNKPDLMVGTSAEIAHIGKLLRIPTINVNEDDWHVIPFFSYLTYPFTDHLLAPSCCDVGYWKKKNIPYDSYHELAYLHSKYFSPDRSLVKYLEKGEKNFILRFAKLNAHHDFGKSGISIDIAKAIIKLLSNHGRVLITSERELEPELEEYRIKINPIDIHHALSFADIYIGDSQTMAAEAAVLGTPSLRFNDFVGKIGYLEELEHKYKLTYGIKTSEPEVLYKRIADVLEYPNIKDEWRKRRDIMLKDKIDLTAFLIWLIEEYPNSINIIYENPEYQYKFKFDR